MQTNRMSSCLNTIVYYILYSTKHNVYYILRLHIVIIYYILCLTNQNVHAGRLDESNLIVNVELQKPRDGFGEHDDLLDAEGRSLREHLPQGHVRRHL